jgi:hypothetical protein
MGGSTQPSLLPLLCSAPKKDDKEITVLAEINPVARAEVEPVLMNPAANAFHVREVTLPMRVTDTATFSRGLRGNRL